MSNFKQLTITEQEELMNLVTSMKDPKVLKTVHAWADAAVLGGVPLKQQFIRANTVTKCVITGEPISGEYMGGSGKSVTPLEATRITQNLVVQIAKNLIDGNPINEEMVNTLEGICDGSIAVYSNRQQSKGEAGYFPMENKDGNVIRVNGASPITQKGIDIVTNYNDLYKHVVDQLGDEDNLTQEEIHEFFVDMLDEVCSEYLSQVKEEQPEEVAQ